MTLQEVRCSVCSDVTIAKRAKFKKISITFYAVRRLVLRMGSVRQAFVQIGKHCLKKSLN